MRVYVYAKQTNKINKNQYTRFSIVFYCIFLLIIKFNLFFHSLSLSLSLYTIIIIIIKQMNRRNKENKKNKK